jgi:hypothetical protein
LTAVAFSKSSAAGLILSSHTRQRSDRSASDLVDRTDPGGADSGNLVSKGNLMQQATVAVARELAKNYSTALSQDADDVEGAARIAGQPGSDLGWVWARYCRGLHGPAVRPRCHVQSRRGLPCFERPKRSHCAEDGRQEINHRCRLKTKRRFPKICMRTRLL